MDLDLDLGLTTLAFLNDSDFIDFEDSMLNNTIDDRNSTINIEETNETSNNRLGKDSCKKQAENGLQSRFSENGSVALWIKIAVILDWR